MLFKSPVYSSVSGSIAGLVYSHNQAGMYTRSRAVPTNPNTDAQQNVRNQQRILIDNWSNVLTSTQRDGWNLYAFNTPVLGPLGDPTKRSGQNMYVRGNLARMQAGFSAVNTAPTTYDLGSFTPITFVADASADTIIVSFSVADPWSLEAGGYMHIFQSRPQNAARNFFKGPYQLLGVIEGEDPGPITSPNTFPSLFPLEVGQRVFLKINVSRADGRYTDPQRIDALVTA